MSSLYNRCDCEAAIGTLFRAEAETGTEPVELTLQTVTDHSAGSESHECYSLLLKGCASRPLGQGLYRLSSAGFPGDEVFLTPVRPGEDMLFYEVIFNRLRDPHIAAARKESE